MPCHVEVEHKERGLYYFIFSLRSQDIYSESPNQPTNKLSDGDEEQRGSTEKERESEREFAKSIAYSA